MAKTKYNLGNNPDEQTPIVTYHGKSAIAPVERDLNRKLSYPEKRVTEEEGYVTGKYYDTKGVLTSGVGQTGDYMDKSFDETYKIHVDRLKDKIPTLDSLPANVQAELIQAEYRGDVGKEHNWLKLFNEGKYKEASKKFLDNKDYRESKKEKTGVHKRMKKVAQAIASLAPTNKPLPVKMSPADIRNYTYERDVRNYSGMEPGIQEALAMEEPDYVSMEELLGKKSILSNPFTTR